MPELEVSAPLEDDAVRVRGAFNIDRFMEASLAPTIRLFNELICQFCDPLC